MELTAQQKREVNRSVIAGERVTKWADFFYCSDKLDAWLTKNIGITADANESELSGATFRFNWIVQKWAVRP